MIIILNKWDRIKIKAIHLKPALLSSLIDEQQGQMYEWSKK